MSVDFFSSTNPPRDSMLKRQLKSSNWFVRLWTEIVVSSWQYINPHPVYSTDRSCDASFEGRVSYFGKSKDSGTFWEDGIFHETSDESADFVLELVNSDFGEKKNVQKIIDTWHESRRRTRERFDLTRQDSAKGFHSREHGFWSKRSFISISRNPELYILRFDVRCDVLVSWFHMLWRGQINKVFLMIMSILWTIAFSSYGGMLSLSAVQTHGLPVEITNGRYLERYHFSCDCSFRQHFCNLDLSPQQARFGSTFSSPVWIHFRCVSLVFLGHGVHLCTIDFAILVASVFPSFTSLFSTLNSQLFVFNGYYYSGNMLAPMIFY